MSVLFCMCLVCIHSFVFLHCFSDMALCFLYVPLEFCCSSTASSMFCLFMAVFCQDSRIINSTRRDFKFIFRAPFQFVGWGAAPLGHGARAWQQLPDRQSDVRCWKFHEIFLLLFFGKFQRLVSPISQLYNITIIRKEDHDLIWELRNWKMFLYIKGCFRFP